jgi:ribosomal protein S8
MNAKKARKTNLVTTKFSKLLMSILELMKQYGYIDYIFEEGKLTIEFKELNECRAIKPRYTVNKKNINEYVKRFLPARNFGYIIVSTNKGLMTHQDAADSKVGGSLIAYFY